MYKGLEDRYDQPRYISLDIGTTVTISLEVLLQRYQVYETHSYFRLYLRC